jgi:hypothetical protein
MWYSLRQDFNFEHRTDCIVGQIAYLADCIVRKFQLQELSNTDINMERASA